MIIDFKYGAINQFNTTLFPIWNWSTRSIPEMVVVGLATTLKEGMITVIGKQGNIATTLKESSVKVTKVD